MWFINNIPYVGKTFAVCPRSPILECACEDNNYYFDICAKYSLNWKVEEFETNSSVRSYHMYQDDWTPVVEEQLLCEREEGNP